MQFRPLLRWTWACLAGVALCVPGAASAQSLVWFEGDYLFWGQANTTGRQYVTGGAASDNGSFGFTNGYRLTVGGALGDYEIEAIFSKLDGWGDRSYGLLGLPLAFDNSAGNPLLFPAGASTLAFPNGVYTAATLPAENTEGEFLLPGAAVTTQISSNLRDFQLNVGGNRTLSWLRWGIGYRSLRLASAGGVMTSGTFNALDLNDGLGPGAPLNNDPNDGLAHSSLPGAGFTLISGDPNGFRAINPLIPSADGLTALFAGSADNRLDGAQLFFAARSTPHELFTIEGFLRLGLFYNRASGSYTELLAGSQDSNSVYLRNFSATRDRASFGVNPGFKSYVHLTDYISLGFGYELLVLTGIAQGADQVGNVQANLAGGTRYNLDSNGVFVGHGGNVGLEVTW